MIHWFSECSCGHFQILNVSQSAALGGLLRDGEKVNRVCGYFSETAYSSSNFVVCQECLPCHTID